MDDRIGPNRQKQALSQPPVRSAEIQERRSASEQAAAFPAIAKGVAPRARAPCPPRHSAGDGCDKLPSVLRSVSSASALPAGQTKRNRSPGFADFPEGKLGSANRRGVGRRARSPTVPLFSTLREGPRAAGFLRRPRSAVLVSPSSCSTTESGLTARRPMPSPPQSRVCRFWPDAHCSTNSAYLGSMLLGCKNAVGNDCAVSLVTRIPMAQNGARIEFLGDDITVQPSRVAGFEHSTVSVEPAILGGGTGGVDERPSKPLDESA